MNQSENITTQTLPQLALPPFLRGSLAFLLMLLNTIFWCVPLYIITFLKLLIPIPAWRNGCTQILVRIAQNWIDGNNRIFRLARHTEWIVEGVHDLQEDEWYLLAANHQSWLDIFVLQKVFNRRIPFLKFFLKQELIWFPFLGIAWWALDFPFMKRYSREFQEKHPELRGKDLETTRKMCARFQHYPVSIINFLEGTRFCAEKRDEQNVPFRHLLKPKAGGIATALAVMNERMRTLLNVTIVYPNGKASFWEFLCGQTPRIIVHVEKLTVPQRFLRGDYLNDANYREQFQTWVWKMWEQKDALLNSYITTYEQASPHQSS